MINPKETRVLNNKSPDKYSGAIIVNIVLPKSKTPEIPQTTKIVYTKNTFNKISLIFLLFFKTFNLDILGSRTEAKVPGITKPA